MRLSVFRLLITRQQKSYASTPLVLPTFTHTSNRREYLERHLTILEKETNVNESVTKCCRLIKEMMYKKNPENIFVSVNEILTNYSTDQLNKCQLSLLSSLFYQNKFNKNFEKFSKNCSILSKSVFKLLTDPSTISIDNRTDIIFLHNYLNILRMNQIYDAELIDNLISISNDISENYMKFENFELKFPEYIQLLSRLLSYLREGNNIHKLHNSPKLTNVVYRILVNLYFVEMNNCKHFNRFRLRQKDLIDLFYNCVSLKGGEILNNQLSNTKKELFNYRLKHLTSFHLQKLLEDRQYIQNHPEKFVDFLYSCAQLNLPLNINNVKKSLSIILYHWNCQANQNKIEGNNNKYSILNESIVKQKILFIHETYSLISERIASKQGFYLNENFIKSLPRHLHGSWKIVSQKYSSFDKVYEKLQKSFPPGTVKKCFHFRHFKFPSILFHTTCTHDLSKTIDDSLFFTYDNLSLYYEMLEIFKFNDILPNNRLTKYNVILLDDNESMEEGNLEIERMSFMFQWSIYLKYQIILLNKKHQEEFLELSTRNEIYNFLRTKTYFPKFAYE
ncbi:hypothetical protein SNEBB_003948 [Seison nebaliae]|nr:hypothetical protein SNEBB_003948 [Seison nebaliae]